MSASAVDIAALRELIAEPTTTPYSDAELTAIIERFPLVDEDGYEPDDSSWTPVYDLNAAAADIWGRKAALVAGQYDFSADGATFHRSQAAKEMRAQARYFAARRSPRSSAVHVAHDYERDMQSTYWQSQQHSDDEIVANAPEDEE